MLSFAGIYPETALLSSIDNMILRTTTELAQLVRARRTELGLTQEELANLAGLHRTSIGLFEQGRRMGGLESILRILHTLGMDLEVHTRGG